MRKRIRFLSMVILLSMVLPVQGGMRGMPNAARSNIFQRMSTLMKQPAMWRQRLQAWWFGPQQKISSPIPPIKRSSPFVEQKMYFSTSAVPAKKSSRLWLWVMSFFKGKSLTPQEIDELLCGIVVKNWVDPTGKMHESGRVFGEKELQDVVAQLGSMIDNDPRLKNNTVNKWKKFIPFKKMSDFRYKIPQTILDMALFRFLYGTPNGFERILFTPDERSLNQIKLIKYLRSKGATVDPDNIGLYEYAYIFYLMRSYKELYNPNAPSLYGRKYEIEKFKKIFKELDPIFEEMIPGFKEKLKQAQKEREMLEENPQTPQRNAFIKELPGLSMSASDREIQEAYRKYALENHPDRLRELPQGEREERTQKYTKVNQARSAYIEELKRMQTAPIQPQR